MEKGTRMYNFSRHSLVGRKLQIHNSMACEMCTLQANPRPAWVTSYTITNEVPRGQSQYI